MHRSNLARSIRTRTRTIMTSAASTTPKQLPLHRLPVATRTLQGATTRLELDDEPSAQRRNTTFSTSTRGVWARTLPLWAAWPLRITRDEAIALGVDVDGGGPGVSVEDVLRRWDPVDVESTGDNGLRVASAPHRLNLTPVLLGVAEKARAEALPHLDIGDIEAQTEAGAALADILSGRKILSNDTYGPWSTRYCGHQFGEWAGQLGDGRAISLIETEVPGADGERCEIQVKGAGRTPFSRQADGLAVLRSGVREYLGCEAIAALGIPTTRALAILSAPVPVMREQGVEPASLVARLAPSFIRIGHFEAMNPGESGRGVRTLFLGGSWNAGGHEKPDPSDPMQGNGNLEGLRDLVNWVKDDILRMQNASAKEWFLDVVCRNARTTALWQAYGFMHGVLNTDNISILGLTIDYGPYAFMDVWDPMHICNHSDPSGLYSYKNQPSRVLFALDSLASALLPILGYEAKNGALPSEGWSAGVTADDVRAWDAAGLEAIDGWNKVWDAEFEAAEAAAWAKRFGLRTQQQTDARRVVRDHLSLLQAHSADFSTSLRLLSFFDPARVAEDSYLSAFTARWVAAACGDLPSDSATRAREDITAWLRTYAARIDADELAAWCDQDRLKAMRAVNPRFVLRQWVLEDTIKQMDEALDKDDVAAARKVLARALDMSTSPFEAYGEDADGVPSACDVADEEAAERFRLCGVGPRGMLGFQCSCSS